MGAAEEACRCIPMRAHADHFSGAGQGQKTRKKPFKSAGFPKLLCWLLISSELNVVGLKKMSLGCPQNTLLGTLSLPLGG